MGRQGVLRERSWEMFGGEGGGKVGGREVVQRVGQGGSEVRGARMETMEAGQGGGKRRGPTVR